MKRLVLSLALIMLPAQGCSSGATPPPQAGGGPAPTAQPATYYHDLVHRASCWMTPQGGISCIADRQIEAVP